MCRRLRGVGSDPSLWHAIAVSYHGPRDDPRLTLALNLSVPHTRKFTLTVARLLHCRECPISKFLPFLKLSPSVTSLSLYGSRMTYEQLNDIVSALPRLVDLKVQLRGFGLWSESEACSVLQLTSHLQSLIIVNQASPPGYDVNDHQYILPAWSSYAKYYPPDLGLQLLPTVSHYCAWRYCNLRYYTDQLPPTDHKAKFSLYSAPSAFTTI